MTALLTDLQVSAQRRRAALTERAQHVLLFWRDEVLLLQLRAVCADDLSHVEARAAFGARARRVMRYHDCPRSPEPVIAHRHEHIQGVGQPLRRACVRCT